jgi:hypothetical protein
MTTQVIINVEAWPRKPTNGESPTPDDAGSSLEEEEPMAKPPAAAPTSRMGPSLPSKKSSPIAESKPGPATWSLVAVVPASFDVTMDSHRTLYQNAFTSWKRVGRDEPVPTAIPAETSLRKFGPADQIIILAPSEALERSLSKVMAGKAVVARVSTNSFGTPLVRQPGF